MVVAIRVMPGAGIRYDLTISYIHTFEVGDGRWVVHNCLVTGDPPNGWISYGSDPADELTPASDLTNFDHESGLGASFKSGNGELSLDWLPAKMGDLRHMGPLLDWLGDRVQQVSAHITSNLRILADAPVGSRERRQFDIMIGYINGILSKRGFTGGLVEIITENEGVQLWLKYTRG